MSIFIVIEREFLANMASFQGITFEITWPIVQTEMQLLLSFMLVFQISLSDNELEEHLMA